MYDDIFIFPSGELNELRHSNKKLLEENSKLQTQLETQDESLISLTRDNHALAEKIRRLVDIIWIVK